MHLYIFLNGVSQLFFGENLVHLFGILMTKSLWIGYRTGPHYRIHRAIARLVRMTIITAFCISTWTCREGREVICKMLIWK